nr:nucleotidyl transferase AbiEii/AbiGii toxin family protein [Streptomyces sp. NBC_00857]
MANPTRDTTAGRVYNDLRNLARRNSRSTDEVMVEYILERFLYRLASSSLGREHFVLKGGLLLAQFGARRMTRDVDILGRSFPGTENRDHPQNRGHRRHRERRRRRIRSHDTQDRPHS